MKKLDLVKINSCAPYAVKEDTQEGAYTFIADSGTEFSIGFMPDDLIQSDKYRNRYTMVTSTLLDEYGIDNVASVIIRNDNPNLGKVLAEFGETIEMFSHKPSIS